MRFLTLIHRLMASRRVEAPEDLLCRLSVKLKDRRLRTERGDGAMVRDGGGAEASIAPLLLPWLLCSFHSSSAACWIALKLELFSLII